MNFNLHPFGKRVYAGDTHTVQTAGNLVCVMVELAARMQNGHDDFDGGLALFVHINRDASSVIGNADAVIGADGDFNMSCVSGESFVDTVVNRFIDQMMQTALTGVADIHARTFPNSLKTFQHGDFRGGVLTVSLPLRRILRRIFFRHC